MSIARSLPWEMLQHIFSHCDQPTLAAISLVSFACWELASPILYETVKIVNLDGLASLFYLMSSLFPSSSFLFVEADHSTAVIIVSQEPSLPSDRLRSSPSLLGRIKTLSPELQTTTQTRGPPFDLPEDEYETEDQNAIRLGSPPLVSSLPEPHRLLSFTSSTGTRSLPLHHLILPNWTYRTPVLQDFFPSQIFPFLNPTTVFFRRISTCPAQQACWIYEESPVPWCSTGGYYSSVFLQRWTNLERISMEGMSVLCEGDERFQEDWWQESPCSIWAEEHLEEGRKRGFELVFDFAFGPWSFEDLTKGSSGARDKTLSILDLGGLGEEIVRLMPGLKVVVKVKEGDEGVAEEAIAKGAEEWMQPFITVEVV